MMDETVNRNIGSKDLLLRDNTNSPFLHHGGFVFVLSDVGCSCCFMENDATGMLEKETIPDLIIAYYVERVSMDVLCDSVRQLRE